MRTENGQHGPGKDLSMSRDAALIAQHSFLILLLCALLFALCASAQAQQPAKIPRIGFLLASSPGRDPRIEGFRQGLRELAYVEGKNIAIEWRYAEGNEELVSKLAAELVQLNVEIIVTNGTNVTRAAKNATKTIPIVICRFSGASRRQRHRTGQPARRSKRQAVGASQGSHPRHLTGGHPLEPGKSIVSVGFQRNSRGGTGTGDATAIPGSTQCRRLRWRIPSSDKGQGARAHRGIRLANV
jgi:hypothetical protein